MSAQWARLHNQIDCPMRRGAWYRTLRVSPETVVVDVQGARVTLPIGNIDIVTERPPRWTVVPRPSNAPRIPASWGRSYGVCPNCKNRGRLEGEPMSMRCERCNGLFEVAWDEGYMTENGTG